jgi:hypothetical protein
VSRGGVGRCRRLAGGPRGLPLACHGGLSQGPMHGGCGHTHPPCLSASSDAARRAGGAIPPPWPGDVAGGHGRADGLLLRLVATSVATLHGGVQSPRFGPAGVTAIRGLELKQQCRLLIVKVLILFEQRRDRIRSFLGWPPFFPCACSAAFLRLQCCKVLSDHVHQKCKSICCNSACASFWTLIFAA